MAALKYWVWLTALPGLSNRSRLLLLERYGSPEDVYYADAEELALTEGLTPGQAQLLSDKSLTRADRILADCARGDIFLLTMQDAAYPARLRDIFDPPVLLSGHHGNVDDWRKKESYKRTMVRRPDMFARFDETQLTTKHDRKVLQQAKDELRQEQEDQA